MPRRHKIDTLEVLRDELADVFHKVRKGSINPNNGKLLAFLGQTLTGVIKAIDERDANGNRFDPDKLNILLDALGRSSEGLWDDEKQEEHQGENGAALSD